MITNFPKPDAYSLTNFTWVILYKEQAYGNRNADAAAATVMTIKWLTGPNAQAIANSVNYASLPQNASDQASILLKGVTFNGETILK